MLGVGQVYAQKKQESVLPHTRMALEALLGVKLHHQWPHDLHLVHTTTGEQVYRNRSASADVADMLVSPTVVLAMPLEDFHS